MSAFPIRRSVEEDTFIVKTNKQAKNKNNTVPELLDIVFKQAAKCPTSGKSMLALVSERKQLAKQIQSERFPEGRFAILVGKQGKNGDNGWNKARKWGD